MDRIFVVQAEYWKKENPTDGLLIQVALKEFCGRNMDSFQTTAGMQSPGEILADIRSKFPGHRVVPVGSIEFAKTFLEAETGKCRMEPIEVPECMRDMLCRHYKIVPGYELSSEEKSGTYFIKDASELKAFNNSLIDGNISRYIREDRDYVVTERTVFDSEWRVFVYHDDIRDVKLYQGEAYALPSEKTLLKMIGRYSIENHPGAYTLDIGTRRHNGIRITEPLEVHPFVSCGLYGFYDSKLPDMWDEGYEWYLAKNLMRQ